MLRERTKAVTAKNADHEKGSGASADPVAEQRAKNQSSARLKKEQYLTRINLQHLTSTLSKPASHFGGETRMLRSSAAVCIDSPEGRRRTKIIIIVANQPVSSVPPITSAGLMYREAWLIRSIRSSMSNTFGSAGALSARQSLSRLG